MNVNMYKELNIMLYFFWEVSVVGVLIQLFDVDWVRLNVIFVDVVKFVKVVVNFVKVGIGMEYV